MFFLKCNLAEVPQTTNNMISMANEIHVSGELFHFLAQFLVSFLILEAQTLPASIFIGFH